MNVRSGSKPTCLANEPIGCARKPVRNAQAINSRMVGYSEVIQFDGLSAFRPCGRDLVEFFNSTGWALYGQVAVPMRVSDAGRLPRNIFHPVQIGCELACSRQQSWNLAAIRRRVLP